MLMIIGALPLYENGNMNLGVIIAGLVLIIATSIISCFIAKSKSKKYYKPLYDKYNNIIKKALENHLLSYISIGLQWELPEKHF